VDPQKREHAHEMSCKFDYNCEFEAMFETVFGPDSMTLLSFFERKIIGKKFDYRFL
jgi:hypothetical protein